jgi:hypothetical protein
VAALIVVLGTRLALVSAEAVDLQLIGLPLRLPRRKLQQNQTETQHAHVMRRTDSLGLHSLAVDGAAIVPTCR